MKKGQCLESVRKSWGRFCLGGEHLQKWVSQVKRRRDGASESQACKMDKKASGKCKEYADTVCYRPLLKDSQKKKGKLVNVHYYYSTGVPGAIYFCTHFHLY